VIVIDNFLTDDKALQAINYSKFWEDKSFYFRKADFNGFEKVDSKGSIGSYIVERMLEESEIVENYPCYSAYGYEYWPTVLMPGMDTQEEDGQVYSLDIHSDYDVVKYNETGELSYPLFGAILYFGNEDVVGGFLQVENKEIKPINNRLVVFDSAKPHGVTEVTKGIRKSIAINFWLEPIMTVEGSLE